MENNLAQSGKLLNDQEYRLLSYYQSFPTSWTFHMDQMMDDLQWSKSKIERTRISLTKKGFLLIRRLPKNSFIYYIGANAVYEYLADKQRNETLVLSNDEEQVLKKLKMYLEIK